MCKVAFSPVAFVVSLLFIIGGLVMLPFAYIKSLVHKWILYKNKRKVRKLVEALTFTVTGIPILLINQVFDYLAFLRHIYSWDMK